MCKFVSQRVELEAKYLTSSHKWFFYASWIFGDYFLQLCTSCLDDSADIKRNIKTQLNERVYRRMYTRSSQIKVKQYTAGHLYKASSPKGYQNQQISDGEYKYSALLRC